MSASLSPSASPSKSPSASPSKSPSASPSKSPSASPSKSPSASPSKSPSASPSLSPSASPSKSPSASPSKSPSASPSLSPSASLSPSMSPSESPSPSLPPYTYSYIEYQYPVSYFFHKEIFWVDRACKVYFALKLIDTDSWVFYAGNSSHELETGKTLTSYGTSEDNAKINYLNATPDSKGKVLAVLPVPFQAKYVRIYIAQGWTTTIREWRPSTFFTAHEIISGEIEISDELSDSPKVSVIKSGTTRLVLGKEGESYGLFGFNNVGEKIFELSDSSQTLAGWSFDKDDLTSTSGEIVLRGNSTGGGPFIRSGNYVSGPLGVGFQIDENKAEFQNITARGKLSCVVFEKNTISSVGGQVLISNSDVLATPMTALDSSTLTISDAYGGFAVDEILQISSGSQSEYLRVTNIGSAPTYTVARDLTNLCATDTNPAWQKGTAVVSRSVAGGGHILLDASTDESSPAIKVYKRNSSAWSDIQEVVRMGNLRGYLDYSATQDRYGIAGGAAENYFKIDPITGVTVSGNLTSCSMSGGTISGTTLIGLTIKTSESGKRVELNDEGISLIQVDNVSEYNTTATYGPNSHYGPTTLGYIHNTTQNVPFYINSDTAFGDFHYYNKGSLPTGVAEVGDTCVVNAVMQLCTVASLPKTWSPLAKAGSNTGDFSFTSIGETSAGTIRGLNKEIIKTTDTVLTALEVSGTVINNYGQGSENVTLTLPTIAAGLSFTVIIGQSRSYWFRIKAGTNDRIFLNGVDPGGNNGFVSPGATTCTLGQSATFFAFQNGAGHYDWFCSTIYGTWGTT